MITREAYAKINLSLDVTGRRPNGYHEVRMIMQTIGLHDTLTFEECSNADKNGNGTGDSKKVGIELEVYDDEGRKYTEELIGPVEKNLVYRAALMVMETKNVESDVKIVLTKRIPVAAGMAGGSTDAAAVFHGLNDLFKLNMTLDEMCGMGVKLGADIPFCIMGGTALSEGIGEILTPIESPAPCHLLIAKPAIGVSTPYVYKKYDTLEENMINHPDVDGMIDAIKNSDIKDIADRIGNVLEFVTEEENPIIGKYKRAMMDEGALNAMMSGSGPTVFGIFDYSEDGLGKARLAEKKIKMLGGECFTQVTNFK